LLQLLDSFNNSFLTASDSRINPLFKKVAENLPELPEGEKNIANMVLNMIEDQKYSGGKCQSRLIKVINDLCPPPYIRYYTSTHIIDTYHRHIS